MSVKLAWAIAALGSFIALLYSVMRYRMFWLAVGAIWLGTAYFGPQDFKDWLAKPPPPPTVVEKVVYVPQAPKVDLEELKRVERTKTLMVAAGYISNAQLLDKNRVGSLTNKDCQDIGQSFISKIDAHTKLVNEGLTVYTNDFRDLIGAQSTWMKSYNRLCKNTNGFANATARQAPKPVHVAAPTPAVVVYEAKPIDEYTQARCAKLIENRDASIRQGYVSLADSYHANYLKTCK